MNNNNKKLNLEDKKYKYILKSFQNKKIDSDNNLDNLDICAICLDQIKYKSKINSCRHKFCFDCIKKWAEISNKCPLCKKTFNDIIFDLFNSKN